jgi:hypothetical protein
MSSPSSSQGHEEWEALVGKALLRFGDIEYVSLRCLSHIPKDRIANSAGRLPFASRADLIIEMLEARSDRSADLERVLGCIRRAKTLAKRRNLIAHNPLMLSLYINEDETEHTAEYSISSARSGAETMDLASLKEFAAEVEDVSSELWMAYMRLTDSSEVLFGHQPVESWR